MYACMYEYVYFKINYHMARLKHLLQTEFTHTKRGYFIFLSLLYPVLGKMNKTQIIRELTNWEFYNDTDPNSHTSQIPNNEGY